MSTCMAPWLASKRSWERSQTIHTGDQFACWFRDPVERLQRALSQRAVGHRALRLGRDLRAASLALGGVCCPQTGRVVSRAHRLPEAPPAACYLGARKTLNRWPQLSARCWKASCRAPCRRARLTRRPHVRSKKLWRPPCHTVTLGLDCSACPNDASGFGRRLCLSARLRVPCWARWLRSTLQLGCGWRKTCNRSTGGDPCQRCWQRQ